MKVLLTILLVIVGYLGIAQTRPSGLPSQFSTGWFRQGFNQSDSGHILANRDTTFLPRFNGTIVLRPQDKKIYYYDSTQLRWFRLAILGDPAGSVD